MDQLIAENLSAVRDTSILFKALSFQLDNGQSLLITGENGAGKSTLLRIIAGLLKAETGTIRIQSDVSISLRNNIHYLGHQNAMKPNLSVRENLRFWQAFDYHDEQTESASIDQALEKVGLAGKDTLPFAVLSTGQKRRVAIARLLLNKRLVWLLDEPTSGLDKPSTHMLEREMSEHLRGGGIVIAATHLPLGLDEPRTLQLGAPL